MYERRPDIFFESSVFPLAIRIAIVSLSVIHSDVIYASLDLLRGIVTHDALDLSNRTRPPKFPIYEASIRRVISTEGLQLTANLLNGLVNDFPEESVSTVITIFRMLANLWPQQLLEWLPQVLDKLPMASSFTPAKQKLLEDVTKQVYHYFFTQCDRC